MAEQRVKSGPLKGIKVLDFTQFQNGPFSTCLLGDYGATVVKVEPIGNGSPERQTFGLPGGWFSLHMLCNRGKRSIQINVKDERSRPLLERLVKWADVVVENFSVGTMERFGWGWEALQAVNPGVIYCSNSGFGPKGAWSRRRSFDMIGQGMSGVMVAQGGGPTHGTPQQVLNGNICDQVGGIMAAMAIMGALVHKARTGEGQRVDTSQLGAMMTLNALDMNNFLHYEKQRLDSGQPPGTGRWDQQGFRCKGGKKWINICWPTQRIWEFGLTALERTDLLEIGSNTDMRVKNRVQLYDEVQKTISNWDRQDLLDVLIKAKVPVGPIYDYADAAADPHMWENGYIDRLPDGSATVGVAATMSKTPPSVGDMPPEAGQHTNDVLRTMLGFSEEEAQAMLAHGYVQAQGGGSGTKSRL